MLIMVFHESSVSHKCNNKKPCYDVYFVPVPIGLSIRKKTTDVNKYVDNQQLSNFINHVIFDAFFSL